MEWLLVSRVHEEYPDHIIGCPTLWGIVQHHSFHFISTLRTGRVHVVAQRCLVHIGFRTVKLATPPYGDLDNFVFASISGFKTFDSGFLHCVMFEDISLLFDNDRAASGVFACPIKFFWGTVVRWPNFKCCSKLPNFI